MPPEQFIRGHHNALPFSALRYLQLRAHQVCSCGEVCAKGLGPQEKTNIMNLANKLTLSRIVVIPFFLVALEPKAFHIGGSPLWEPSLRVVALILFVAASITDYWDGKLARTHGWITPFGQLMDPLADKVLVMSAFVSFVALGTFPSWMVVLILAREFMITGLRQLASAQGIILSADRWGKNKTISQMTVIITALTFLAAEGWLKYFGLWNADVMRRWEVSSILSWILHIMMWITVVLTVVSGWRYCVINYRLFKDN